MVDGRVSFSVEAVVRGYRAYKDIWAAVYGEESPCEREAGNRVDAFAMVVDSCRPHSEEDFLRLLFVLTSRRIDYMSCNNLKIFTTKFLNFHGLNFRGFYFRVSVVGRENRENLDLAKIFRYTVS